MKKLFVFDLDGTLVDAYRAIRESLNFTLKLLGYEKVSMPKVKKTVGRGDVLFIKTFFPRADVDKALRLYRSHHKKSLRRYTKLLPFTKSTLAMLKRKKRYTAVASNRPTLFTNIILKKLGLMRYIDYVLCADRVRKIKPHPRILLTLIERCGVTKEETVFVGDMDIDLLTAKRANVESVFIKGGSTPLGEIRKKYPEAKVISSLKEVVRLYG